MRVGEEVKGGTKMKWAEFGASTASVVLCVGARGDCAIVAVDGRLCRCDYYHSTWSNYFVSSSQGTVAALILQKLPRPPALCFHDPDSLGVGFLVMHIPNRVSRSFCTYGPTNRLDKVLPSELIKSGGTGTLSLLGFNNLFLNQPLFCHTLRPTFRILLVTKKCLFRLKI